MQDELWWQQDLKRLKHRFQLQRILVSLQPVSFPHKHLWHYQWQHIFIVVELIKALYLLARDHHIVEGEVINEPAFHPPQDIGLIEGTPCSYRYVL